MTLFLISLLGAYSTYFANHRLKLGSIKASALSIILFSLSLKLWGLGEEIWEQVFFGATFIGMSDKSLMTLFNIITACIVYYVFFKVLILHLSAIGGALGFCAFSSVLITVKLNKLNKLIK